MIGTIQNYEIERTGAPGSFVYTPRRWRPEAGWQDLAPRPNLLRAIGDVVVDAVQEELVLAQPPDEDAWALSRYRLLFGDIANGLLPVRFRQ